MRLGLTLLLGLFAAAHATAEESTSSRAFDEASRRLQKTVQYFSGDNWIEKKAEKPATSAAVAPFDFSAPTDSTAAPVVNPAGQALTHWMPYCFLAEDSVSAKAVNEKIKLIADQYASCGIVVEPYTFTVHAMPGVGAAQLQELARTACNFDRALGVRGAIQLDTKSASLPKEMCSDSGAAGCSTLCEPLSFALVGPGAAPVVGLHESLHGNCCGQSCVDEGQGRKAGGPGIELTSQAPLSSTYAVAEGTALVLRDLPKDACASLQAGASPNDGTHRWQPNRKEYFVHAPTARERIDLNRNQGLIGPARFSGAKALTSMPEPTLPTEKTLAEAMSSLPVRSTTIDDAPVEASLGRAPASDNFTTDGPYRQKDRVAAAQGGKRKRGASIKSSRKAVLSRKTDNIVSSRSAPDFQVDPNFVNAVDVGYGGGGGDEGGEQ